MLLPLLRLSCFLVWNSCTHLQLRNDKPEDHNVNSSSHENPQSTHLTEVKCLILNFVLHVSISWQYYCSKTCFTKKLFLCRNFKAVVCCFFFSVHYILYGCGDLRHSFMAVLHIYNCIRQFEYFTCTGSLNKRFYVLHFNCTRDKILFNV